jgi:Tol biopolymer transport system component
MKTLTVSVAALLAAVLMSATGASSGTRPASDADSSIAYSCSGDICLTSLGGDSIRRLTHDKYVDAFPSWSPDGEVIAFTAFPRRMRVDVMSSDGRRRSRLTSGSGDAALPVWSPDGRTIAFDDDTTRTIELLTTTGSVRHPLGRRVASLPSWSPDGHEIAFVSKGGRNLVQTYGEIHAVNLATGHVRLLTRDGTFPVWSPDGTRLAFVRRDGSQTWLWTMGADGSEQQRLCRAAAGRPAWAPSGRRIAFALDGDIYTVPSSGGSLQRVTFGHGDNLDPAWQPAAR